jgi:hypothetical protein
MGLNRIAENWNGQVGKLFNWTINRLASVADKGDVKAIRLPSVKTSKHAGQEEYNEMQHEGPGGRQVS